MFPPAEQSCVKALFDFLAAAVDCTPCYTGAPFSKHPTFAGMTIQRCAERVQICLRTICTQFGSSEVPPLMPRVPGLLSAVHETVVPHPGQKSMRSQPRPSNYLFLWKLLCGSETPLCRRAGRINSPSSRHESHRKARQCDAAQFRCPDLAGTDRLRSGDSARGHHFVRLQWTVVRLLREYAN